MNLFRRLYDYATGPTRVKNQMNEYRPRANVSGDLLGKFKKGVNELDDDLDGGVVTNVFDRDNSKNTTSIYKTFLDETKKPFNPENNPRDIIQRFEGKGLERANIPGNDVINARVNLDDFRAEVLGGSDLAKRVVYWSGNNALHNRYDNLPFFEKLRLAKTMRQFGIKAPHRIAIAPNASNTKKGNNTTLHDNKFYSGADKTLLKDLLENGIIDAGIATPGVRGILAKENENWVGMRTAKGSRVIPTVHTIHGGHNAGSYSNRGDALDRYLVSGKNFLSGGDHYPINAIAKHFFDNDTAEKSSLTLDRLRSPWTGPATFLHEVDHAENINFSGSDYLEKTIPKKIGFWNPHAYAGSKPEETTRALQSGRIPVTKMLMDKVERLAPDIIPNYSKMSPKEQLDIKAQVISLLAEDNEIAQASWNRWGLFNPNRASKKPSPDSHHLVTTNGLDYRIPRNYLTGESSMDPEIVNSIIGLDRAAMYESASNPKWKKFLKMYYPQQIAGITAAATPAVYSALQNGQENTYQ